MLGGAELLAVTKSVGMTGLSGCIIEVEVDVANGLPAFDIVGLPNTSVKESKERVRAALRNSGFEFPMGRITVNLAPADLKKEGPVFDLPIAVGLMAASGQLPNENFKNYIFMGELSLDGRIKGVSGILPGVLVVRSQGLSLGVVVSVENADEAALARDVEVFPVENLLQVNRFLSDTEVITRHEVDISDLFKSGQEEAGQDMSEVHGQYHIKRALEIAAAGGHNILMVGPPGSGKTMLARRISGIIPGLSFEEAIEVTKIYSICGLTKARLPLVINRPFRAPHHSISKIGLIGGGNVPKPGEISLAHSGILFMDEFPEFNRNVMEGLRQPLEDGQVSISRISGSYDYPCNIMLVAAMNPCPCGYFGDSAKECTCTPWQAAKYKSRISGPLFDRIDIHLEVPRIKYEDLHTSGQSETSAEIRSRVERARLSQRRRFMGTDIFLNSRMEVREIRRYCQLEGQAARLMKKAFETLHLSARAYNRILKVARTIADLQGTEKINEKHIAEAIHYRNIDQS